MLVNTTKILIFPIAIAPIYILCSHNNVLRFELLYNLCYLFFLNNCHSNRCEEIVCCSLDLDFPDN